LSLNYERVISPNTTDINYPKNINIITQRSNKNNLNPVPSIELVYKIPTRITVRRNNLRAKTRPRIHARKVVTTNANFKDRHSPLPTRLSATLDLGVFESFNTKRKTLIQHARTPECDASTQRMFMSPQRIFIVFYQKVKLSKLYF
jgi:hypothetical protein